MRIVTVGWTLIWAAAAAGPAAAEDHDYPAAVSERPLALPGSVVEGGARLRTLSYGGYYGEQVGSFSHSYTDAYVRAGLGPLELFVDASVQLSAPDLDGLGDQDSIALDRVGGGARIRVGHEAVVEVRARYLRPMDEVNGIQLESVYLARRKTAERVAAYAGGGLRYHRTMGRDQRGDDELWFAHALGLAGCMVQLDTRLAADFSVSLAIPAADNVSYDAPSIATVGGRLLWVAERFDVFAGVAVSGSGDNTVRELTVGIAGRLP